MSKRLAKLLDQPEKILAAEIIKKEARSGYPSEDARLLAETHQAVRNKLADIGLDPDDTTGEELYQALFVKYAKDSTLFDKALGLTPDADIRQRLARAVKLTNISAQDEQIWTLKHSAAKKLLQQQPPKRLMKKLKYRSVDSLLKRADIAKVFLQLPAAESITWRSSLAKKIAKLGGSEQELRSVEVISLNAQLGSSESVFSDTTVGAVGIWPSAQIQRASTLAVCLLLADGLETLTHKPMTKRLAELSPILLWWEQAKHLLAICDEDIVSLNLKDTLINHSEALDFADRKSEHGRQSLWSELESRYQKRSAALQQSLTNLEVAAENDIAKLAPKQPATATEYAEAIANEF